MAYFRSLLIRLRASCKQRRLVFTACRLADKDLTTVANNSAGILTLIFNFYCFVLFCCIFAFVLYFMYVVSCFVYVCCVISVSSY